MTGTFRKGTSIRDPNNNTRLVELDNLFKALLVIDTAHHEIHEGDGFHCVGADTSMSDAETLILAFKTPAGTKRAHMTFDYGALVAGRLELIEGPTWTEETGSAANIFNHQRASSKTPMLLENRAQVTFTASEEMILNPTGLSGGTAILLGHVYGSKQAGGGRDRGTAEWVLAPGVAYAVRFTADGNSNAGVIILDWYEHTDE